MQKKEKKSFFRPKTPQPAQPFFLSPFLPAQPNPAGPIPSPRPSSRPLSSLPPTGRPHLSGLSPSSRARLGLEPESGHATPRRPSPWRARQGGPTSPLFKRRRSPWKPYRTAAAPQFAQNPSSACALHSRPRSSLCRRLASPPPQSSRRLVSQQGKEPPRLFFLLGCRFFAPAHARRRSTPQGATASPLRPPLRQINPAATFLASRSSLPTESRGESSLEPLDRATADEVAAAHRRRPRRRPRPAPPLPPKSPWPSNFHPTAEIRSDSRSTQPVPVNRGSFAKEPLVF